MFLAGTLRPNQAPGRPPEIGIILKENSGFSEQMFIDCGLINCVI